MESARQGCSTTSVALILLTLSGTCLPFCLGGVEADIVAAMRSACGGRDVGECLRGRRASTEMAPELQQSAGNRYISYRFLNKDAVPCPTPGVPYYSCHAMPTGNPYTRGCYTITRCARESYP